MSADRELKHFPELAKLPLEQQGEMLALAKQKAFGADVKLQRWGGNFLQFVTMFGLSALFMSYIVPTLSLNRDVAALIMLVVVLPIFFIIQQRRYIKLIREALKSLI